MDFIGKKRFWEKDHQQTVSDTLLSTTLILEKNETKARAENKFSKTYKHLKCNLKKPVVL